MQRNAIASFILRFMPRTTRAIHAHFVERSRSELRAACQELGGELRALAESYTPPVHPVVAQPNKWVFEHTEPKKPKPRRKRKSAKGPK